MMIFFNVKYTGRDSKIGVSENERRLQFRISRFDFKDPKM